MKGKPRLFRMELDVSQIKKKRLLERKTSTFEAKYLHSFNFCLFLIFSAIIIETTKHGIALNII